MDLNEMRTRYERKEGYSRLNATARVCQDVILSKLATSSMRNRVTVKGGVLMCALSGSNRRATQDIDLDFVRYPMTDASIRSFISALSNLGDGIDVRIVGEIEELSQQDYRGRRINLKDGSIEDVVRRIERTLSNRRFLARMKSSHRDWIGKSAEDVARWLPRFLRTLYR